jgi:hypothetical protein
MNENKESNNWKNENRGFSKQNDDKMISDILELNRVVEKVS